MKAAVYYGPGEVRVEQVPEPGAPGPGEMLLQVQMGALCGTDASQYKAATMVPLTAPHPISGHQGPVILGHEIVGVVAAIGAGVDHLAVGERVVPGMGWWCGACPQCQAGRFNICENYYLLGIHAHGGLAELARVPAKMCVRVPDGCLLEAAAMAQPLAVALHALRRAGIEAGQTVALFGIGSIGSLLLAALCAQTADVAVLAVDIDAQRLATAQALGATCLIDARATDPVAAILTLTGGRGVEVAIEATGLPETITQALAAVGRGGTLLQVGIPQRPVPLCIDQAVLREKTLLTTNGQVTSVNLPAALTLLTETDLAARVGYRMIPLDAIVEEGLAPLAAHQASAKVLVQVESRGETTSSPSLCMPACFSQANVKGTEPVLTPTETPTETLARDWELCLENPDPPGGTYRYPYHLRAGGQWEALQERLCALSADRFVVVTDSGFPPHLAEMVQQRLHAVSPCTLHTFPGTEQAKNLGTVARLSAEAKQAGATRHSVIVGLGGGLAGNVAGLLAALLYRGMRLVHLPGTLLAMSDSTLSLKQGVNTEAGKNLVGTYKAPAFVWSDLALLDALPSREIRAACCEVIKNVVAICPHHVEEVAGMLRPDARYTAAQYERIIELCIEAKTLVMQHDALEKHDAFVLEAGHTVGHALEFCSQGAIPHGLAIGIGLVVEARIAQWLDLTRQTAVEMWLRALLGANGVPTAIPAAITADDLVPLIAHDNKRGTLDEPEGTVPMVLLTGLGQPHRTNGTVLTPVPLSLVRQALDWSRAQAGDPSASDPAIAPLARVDAR